MYRDLPQDILNNTHFPPLLYPKKTMTDPRASALFSKYVEASITVPSVEQAWVLANLTSANAQWPLKDTETSTLGELV